MLNYSVQQFCRRLERDERTEGESSVAVGNCLAQPFGRVLRRNRGVSACECARVLANVSVLPFQSVRDKMLRQLFQ